MARATRQEESKKQRGSGGRSPEPRYLAIGRVVGVHGIRGEIKVQILTQDPERFGRLERIFVGLEGQEPVPRVLQGVRLHKGRALLKLEGYEDRSAAERLRWHVVQVPLAEAIPVEEDEYYEHQLLGLPVWTVDGEHLGEIVEIIETGANEVFVVSGTGQGEVLIPVIEDVVTGIDLDEGRVEVDLPEGLR